VREKGATKKRSATALRKENALNVEGVLKAIQNLIGYVYLVRSILFIQKG
jgi:hypothetical protein